MFFWYLFVAIVILGLIGPFVHVFRSSFNFFPDIYVRGTGRFWREHWINDRLSANYGFWDMVAGTEYDKDGFYEFFSFRNLRICCIHTIGTGLFFLLCSDATWNFFTGMVDTAPGWFWAMITERLKGVRLF